MSERASDVYLFFLPSLLSIPHSKCRLHSLKNRWCKRRRYTAHRVYGERKRGRLHANGSRNVCISFSRGEIPGGNIRACSPKPLGWFGTFEPRLSRPLSRLRRHFQHLTRLIVHGSRPRSELFRFSNCQLKQAREVNGCETPIPILTRPSMHRRGGPNAQTKDRRRYVPRARANRSLHHLRSGAGN